MELWLVLSFRLAFFLDSFSGCGMTSMVLERPWPVDFYFGFDYS